MKKRNITFSFLVCMLASNPVFANKHSGDTYDKQEKKSIKKLENKIINLGIKRTNSVFMLPLQDKQKKNDALYQLMQQIEESQKQVENNKKDVEKKKLNIFVMKITHPNSWWLYLPFPVSWWCQ